MISTEVSRKDAILKEAAKLFREKGFAATSMRDLASRVGMEAASLYNHIDNKEELLETICRSIAQKHSENLEKLSDEQLSALQKLERLIRHHIQVNAKWPHMSAVAEDEWRHLSEPVQTDFLNKRRAYENSLRSLIDEAKQAGLIKEVNTRIALYTLLSSLQWLYHWFRQDRPIDSSEIEEEMVDLILNGLKK